MIFFLQKFLLLLIFVSLRSEILKHGEKELNQARWHHRRVFIQRYVPGKARKRSHDCGHYLW